MKAAGPSVRSLQRWTIRSEASPLFSSPESPCQVRFIWRERWLTWLRFWVHPQPGEDRVLGHSPLMTMHRTWGRRMCQYENQGSFTSYIEGWMLGRKSNRHSLLRRGRPHHDQLWGKTQWAFKDSPGTWFPQVVQPEKQRLLSRQRTQNSLTFPWLTIRVKFRGF